MSSDEDDYNYDIEDFLLRIIFHNLYNYGSIVSYCQPYLDCDDCTKCPENDYEGFANKVGLNWEETRKVMNDCLGQSYLYRIDYCMFMERCTFWLLSLLSTA